MMAQVSAERGGSVVNMAQGRDGAAGLRNREGAPGGAEGLTARGSSPASAVDGTGSDSASGGGRLSPEALRAWSAFLQAHAVLTRRLEAELAGSTGLSLAHYDVLVQLARADQRRLRMHELADRVLLSRSGISRLVDRLEADGLVSRGSCASDARGSFAVLTDRGLERLRDATPTHFAGICRHFVERFEPAELDQLASLLGRVAPASDVAPAADVPATPLGAPPPDRAA